jgi:uncharacterized membrane protein YebE (DUF533 family)
MIRLIGLILFIGGLVAAAIYGYDAYENTASVKLLGNEITVSQANWTPVIISGLIAIAGLALVAFNKKK